MLHHRNRRRGDAGRRDRRAPLQTRGGDRGAHRRLYRGSQSEKQGGLTQVRTGFEDKKAARPIAAALRVTTAALSLGSSYPSAATKLSITNFRPALSKSTVSFWPSTATTAPGPNLL